MLNVNVAHDASNAVVVGASVAVVVCALVVGASYVDVAIVAHVAYNAVIVVDAYAAIVRAT